MKHIYILNFHHEDGTINEAWSGERIYKRIYDPEKLAEFLINACEQYQKCELISTPTDIRYTDIPYQFLITTWEEA